MKKVIAIMILLVITLTLFSPLRVYADVIVGDNEIDIINENQMIIGRKLATLDVLENLLVNGVSSFTIENVDNVDDYLDYLYTEIDNAYNDYDISDFVDNALDWDALSKLHYNIEKNTLAYATQFNSLGLSLIGIDTLADFISNNQYKDTRKDLPLAYNGLKFLSALTSDIPSPEPDSNYQVFLDFINKRDSSIYQSFYFYDFPQSSVINGSYRVQSNLFPYYNYSWVVAWSGNPNVTTFTDTPSQHISPFVIPTVIRNLYINKISDNYYEFSDHVQVTYGIFASDNDGYTANNIQFGIQNNTKYMSIARINGNNNWNITYSKSGTLEEIFNYIIRYYKNCNIYVDGVPWAIVDIPTFPTLDIDGLLKLNNESPAIYDIPNDISIDYNQLYDVILRAIQNGTPVSMDTITNNNTYYDSHNTVYSPTIYNYYNDDSEDEKDYIDTLISSATVPNFNQTYLIPLTAPLDNGFKALYVGVSWIPDEVLIIFGGLFVLLLFVAILNRMLE